MKARNKENTLLKLLLPSKLFWYSVVFIVAALIITRDWLEAFGIVIMPLSLLLLLYAPYSSNKSGNIIFGGFLFALVAAITGYAFFRIIIRNWGNITDSDLAFVLMCAYLFPVSVAGIICTIKKYQNRSAYRPKASHVEQTAAGPAKRNSSYYFARVDFENPSVIMAEGIVGDLESKGLGHFLESDFVTSHVLSYGDFSSKEKTKKKLSELMSEMLVYLGLPSFVTLNVEYDYSDSRKGASHAGHYKSTSAIEKTITVVIRDVYAPNNAVAVLCHECTHFFMEYHGLNWSDVALNEKKTDVMANLIGFGSIMADGYRPVSKTEQEGSLQKTTTYTIGYISADDCVEIQRFLLYKCQLINEAKQAKKESEILLGKCKLLLETAETLNRSITDMDVRTLRPQSAEEISEIQAAWTEYEMKNCQQIILQLRQATERAQNTSDLEKAIMQIELLCGDLLSWTRVFQKYI